MVSIFEKRKNPFHIQNLKRRKKIIALCLLLIIEEDQHQQYKKRLWVKPWIMRRQEQGIHHNLFIELSLEDPNKFRRYFKIKIIKHFQILFRKKVDVI